MIKIIIFDFDGVIVDSMPLKNQTFKGLFTEHTHHTDAIADYLLENQAASRYEKFSHICKEILDVPFTQRNGDELSRKFSGRVVKRIIESGPVKGALRFFKGHKNIGMYVISATPPEELEHIVNHMDLKGYFRGAYGTTTRKGKGRNIERIIRTEGIERGDVLYVGDTPEDMEIARGLGVNFIGFIINPKHNPFLGKGVGVAHSFDELEGMV
jgi:phosphoglycolate phosphatase-like HAD superfamily hydrolase